MKEREKNSELKNREKISEFEKNRNKKAISLKRGESNMPSKLLEKEETLAANLLRNISQKNLIEMVENNDKLGLIVNNNLAIAMLKWERYAEIVDLIEEQNQRIEELESYLEDIELAQNLKEDVLRIQKGESTSYEFKTAEDLFKMLD